VFYLCDITPDGLIETFVSHYLQLSTVSEGSESVSQITWKNMHYLWRHFLESKNLPVVIFQQKFKEQLIAKLGSHYSEETDSFSGMFSKYLPSIQLFLSFWGETMHYDESEDDFEVEDVVHLFRKWCDEKDEDFINLNDKQIIDIITYYFPELVVERDKYISNIRCSLWDKQLDIQVALETMKESLRGQIQRERGIGSPIVGKHVSIYDAYIFYCKHFSGIANKRFVNKSYFEKYVFDNLGHFILDTKFIHSDWLSS
jgi:hypothetical protein